MPIHCPKCGQEYDVIKFQPEYQIRCRCGFVLDVSLLETADDILRYCEGEEERQRALEIQRDAQAICKMILDEHRAQVDIEIAQNQLKVKVENYFPDKIEAYHMIYESRFNRLWEQFRSSANGLDSKFPPGV